MGQYDDWYGEQEKGWSAPKGIFVCRRCLEDSHLQRVVARNLTDQTCTYCKGKRKAAPLKSIMESIAGAFFREYNTFESAGCSYDKDAPEVPMLPTATALHNLPLECDERLLQDVANSFHNDFWVEAPGGMWMGAHEHEELRWSWNSFVDSVKHETRFHFSHARSKRSRLQPGLDVSDVLPMIGRMAARNGLGAVRKVQ